MNTKHTIEKLLRQQAALAHFGSFAFTETDLDKVLSEAARICAESLSVPYSKICRYRPVQNDLLVVAGYGWEANIVGHVVSQADESSTQGRAYITGEPVILKDIKKNNSYDLPDFYEQHGITSTVDVLIKGKNGPFGVLEADSSKQITFDEHDINFLTGFANVLAEAVGTAERVATLEATLIEMQNLIAQKNELLEEKSTLATELQHRVRNNLQLVYGMLLRQIEVSDVGGREGIRSIARRVMSLSAIYNHLLEHGLIQTIDFGSYLNSLCRNLHDFQEKRINEIQLICKTDSIPLDLDMVTVLGIVVTEVTSNAYLHAFPSRSGIIRVEFSQNDGTGTLTISDDGIGFVEHNTNKRHGVGLIRRLVEQIDGTAKMTIDEGTTWTLTFPVDVTVEKSLVA